MAHGICAGSLIEIGLVEHVHTLSYDSFVHDTILFQINAFHAFSVY